MTGTTARLMLLLDALAAEPEGMQLTDIARSVGLTPSGAHRALGELIGIGVATQTRPRGPYRLGPRALNWTSTTLESRLVACADDPLRHAHETTGEAVSLTVMRDRTMWIIAAYKDGAREPVPANGLRHFHTTARGLVILAHLPPQTAKAIIQATGLPAITPRPITTEKRLWTLTDQARRAGLLWRRDPDQFGTSGIAVPALDHDGHVLGAVVISLRTSQLTAGRQAALEKVAILAARTFEHAWGAIGRSATSATARFRTG